jgi:hypothetical protein
VIFKLAVLTPVVKGDKVIVNDRFPPTPIVQGKPDKPFSINSTWLAPDLTMLLIVKAVEPVFEIVNV